MKILISLSDKTYKDIKEENGIYGTDSGLSARITGKVVGAIQSGTPLSNHGRLIDADGLIKAIEEKAKRLSNADTINGLCGAVALIFDEQTIIEADKKE